MAGLHPHAWDALAHCLQSLHDLPSALATPQATLHASSDRDPCPCLTCAPAAQLVRPCFRRGGPRRPRPVQFPPMASLHSHPSHQSNGHAKSMSDLDSPLTSDQDAVTLGTDDYQEAPAFRFPCRHKCPATRHASAKSPRKHNLAAQPSLTKPPKTMTVFAPNMAHWMQDPGGTVVDPVWSSDSAVKSMLEVVGHLQLNYFSDDHFFPALAAVLGLKWAVVTEVKMGKSCGPSCFPNQSSSAIGCHSKDHFPAFAY